MQERIIAFASAAWAASIAWRDSTAWQGGAHGAAHGASTRLGQSVPAKVEPR